MWRDHVWFGIGPGHFDNRFRAYRPAAVQLQPTACTRLPERARGLGVVGAAIIALALAALFAGLARAWSHVRRARMNSEKPKQQVCLRSGLCGRAPWRLLVHSLVDFNMQIPANAILAISLMALLTSHLRFCDRAATGNGAFGQQDDGQRRFCWSVLVYLGYQEVRLGREYVWLQRARQAEPFHPTK